jgi:hypothetical protein
MNITKPNRMITLMIAMKMFVSCAWADWSWVVPGEYASISPDLFLKGVKEADRFRRGLLQKNASGLTQAGILSEAVMRFQDLAESHLSKENGLKGFKAKKKTLLRAFNGEKSKVKPYEAFSAFDGKWYGIWDKMEVDHHWFPQINQKPAKRVSAFNDIWIHVVQFAWIGDGFGWNIVATEDEDSTDYFILGTVYHVRERDPSQIYLHRPHVGISTDKDQLIWLTRKEIFLEERMPAKGEFPERYAITGCNYQMHGTSRLSVVGNSFQAIYTRKPDLRYPWKQFWINLSAP